MKKWCRMNHASWCMGRAFCGFMFAPRKRVAACFILLALLVIGIIIFSMASARLRREDEMEQQLVTLQSHLRFLESQYRGRQEDVINLQTNAQSHGRSSQVNEATSTTISSEVQALLRNIAGSRAAAGINPDIYDPLRTPFIYQLLPYLMNDPSSLKPAYHMKGGRSFVDVVIGIPTVKRDKENYLMITISHLVEGLTEIDFNSTLIVVMVGDTDLQYVLNTARQIESQFSRAVESGLIEVISPSLTYYPDFDTLPTTLGDSQKRVKWRTKQNLDAIFLMAYGQSKGTFFLMLEDDVVAKKNYMQDIKQFTASTTMSNPNWFFIDYCHVGGIGKLFRSADLTHFITYVQLFYNNMPIDWLMESYLADRVCNMDRTTKACSEVKEKIRPRFKSSLFQHIGLYSSLKGKIQKVKDSFNFGPVPTFFPHTNPPLDHFRTDIEVYADHTLKKAYDGQTFFWGVKPKKGNIVEFWFARPTNVERYTLRSGNVDHTTDKFYETSVEVLPQHGNFTTVGNFDEFGLAEGEVKLGPLYAVRLKVNRDSTYWAILSEIEFIATVEPDSR